MHTPSCRRPGRQGEETIKIQNIGLPLDTFGYFSQLARVESTLARIQEHGYTLVEIDSSPFSLIMDGKIRRPQLDNFRAVLSHFPLRYSIHCLSRLNLAYDPRHELCRQILRCHIEICQAIGGNRVVYHSGLQALDDVGHGVRRTLLTDVELDVGARREVDAFKELGRVAADAGVTICMENGDTHQWEHHVIAEHGLPRHDLLRHHGRLHPKNIVRQLEAIDHPNVAMTLDIAHLHIAANDMGFDYLDAVSVAVPWVKHLHVNDNFGRVDWGFDTEYERWAYGEADIHLPPGWGSIPYHKVFARLPDYEGDLVLEIKSDFQDYLGESLASMCQILDGG